jgi:hypothetical protein
VRGLFSWRSGCRGRDWSGSPPATAADELARLVERFGKDHVVVALINRGRPLDSTQNEVLVGEVRCGDGGVEQRHYSVPGSAPAPSIDDLEGWLPAGQPDDMVNRLVAPRQEVTGLSAEWTMCPKCALGRLSACFCCRVHPIGHTMAIIAAAMSAWASWEIRSATGGGVPSWPDRRPRNRNQPAVPASTRTSIQLSEVDLIIVT